MLLAVVAVLVAVFFLATGRGGELSREPVDYAPLELGSVAASDIAMMRPPTAMWGYNVDVTDEALDRIARAVRDRDLEIAYLQQQLAGREMTSAATIQGAVAALAMDDPLARPDPLALDDPLALSDPLARPDPLPLDDSLTLPDPQARPGPADDGSDEEQGR